MQFDMSNTFLALDQTEHSLTKSKCTILPIPFEATTSYRKGTYLGPSAIIRASAEMEDFDIELGFEPCQIGIYTAPVISPNLTAPDGMISKIADTVEEYLKKGQFIGVLGGEHSVSVGVVKAMSRQYKDLSILVFDAQADLRNEYQGSRYSHACASRRMHDYAPTTIVGVRSITEEELAFADKHQIPIFYRASDNINDVNSIISTLSNNVYISFDLDAFDPSFMASVGTPEPGGLGWWEALDILKKVARQRNIVGFDVVELSPEEGPEACAYSAAKLVYKIIRYATGKIE